MREVCVLLSQCGDSLTLFLMDEFGGYEKIPNQSRLNKYHAAYNKKIDCVLLKQIIHANNPEAVLAVLQEIQNCINQNKLSSDSFLFLHEQMDMFPDHHKDVKLIPNVSNIGTKCNAHQDMLDSLIQFVQEYRFNIFKNDYRQNYVAGFNHQRMSWLESGWVWNAFTQYNNAAFNRGREAALRKR